MYASLGRKASHLVLAAALVSGGLVLAPPLADVAEAASFTAAPERLYMTPAGVTLPNGIAQFVGVKVGTLEFDGSTDPISQDVRTITVDTLTGAALCDLTQIPYDIDDCSRIQIGPVSHGRLSLGPINAIPNGDGNGGTVYMLANNVRIDNDYQVAAGSFTLGINGEPDDLNAILADLVYTPDPGYYYEGSNGETINIVLVPGNSDDNLPEPTTDNDTANTSIEVRVLNVNAFPDITAPADKQAQAGVELKIPTADPAVSPPFTGTEFSLTDPDNDEDVDGAQANPPVAEDPLQDGDGTSMLLIGYLNCGVPTVDNVNGFHFRGGTFQINNNDIQSLVRDFFDFTNLPQEAKDGVTALLTGIDAIAPGLTTTQLATNDPTDPTHLFAGIGSMYEVQYALSQISFLQPAPSDTCTLWTAVSDLGNNGLPLQYFGSPPTGVELPMIGLDIDSFDINTGALDEVDVSFDPGSLLVDESAGPVEVVAELHITPAIHPEFTIAWGANPHVGDPDVVGVATANSDFNGTFNNTLTIPANETTIPISGQSLPSPVATNVLADGLDEGNETFEFELDIATNSPPAGWTITSATPTRTVVIVDDDDAARSITSVSNPTVNEGDSGTTAMTFTLTLDGAADGNETVEVSTGGGDATPGGDYTSITDQVVSFTAGASTATVTVLANGDLADESDETLVLSLTNPTSVTIGDTSGIGTITDDDAPSVDSVISIADATVTEGSPGTTTISRTNAGNPACALLVTSTDGTATEPGDYNAINGNFNLSLATDTLAITPVDDTEIEANETYTITIALTPAADPRCQIGDATATITIASNDVASVVSIADATVTEGSPGTTTISRTNAGNPACALLVTSTDGTATEPGDYNAINGNFNLSLATDTLAITPVDDIVANEGFETYTITIALTPAADPRCQIGDATATITIADNDSSDNVAPTVTINQAVAQTDPTTASPIVFTVVFSEPVSGFVGADVTLSGTAGATTASVSGAGPTYTISVTGMTGSGSVTASVGAGVAVDSNSNANVASTSTDDTVQFNVDTTDPTVTINQAVGQLDPTTNSPILFTVVFSEPVTGFVDGDVTLSGTAGATTASVSGAGPTYTISVTGMTGSGSVTASIAAGVATDAAANTNTASTSTDDTVQFNVDTTDPTVTIDQAVGQLDPTTNSPILFTVVFSEAVFGFTGNDVTLAGTAGATTATVTGGPVTFQVAVSGMTQSGTVIASIEEDVVADAATNVNTASTSTDNTVQFNIAPGPLTLNLPANIVTNNDPGQAGAIVNYPAVTASGGAPPTTVVCTPAAGTFFGLGTTTVNCIATDSGAAPQERFTEATTTGSFTVRVNDAEPPVIADPPDLVRTTTNTTPVSVTFVNPTATDNAGVPTVVCTPISGTSFPVGVSTVTCTATDAAGNQATSAFTITVNSNPSGAPLPPGGAPLPPTGNSPRDPIQIAMAITIAGLILLIGANRRRLLRTAIPSRR